MHCDLIVQFHIAANISYSCKNMMTLQQHQGLKVWPTFVQIFAVQPLPYNRIKISWPGLPQSSIFPAQCIFFTLYCFSFIFKGIHIFSVIFGIDDSLHTAEGTYGIHLLCLHNLSDTAMLEMYNSKVAYKLNIYIIYIYIYTYLCQQVILYYYSV